jgi:hypothetical protein
VDRGLVTTGHAVRVFADLALTALAYDTTAARAGAEIEGRLQRLFNVRLVPNVSPEIGQIVLGQTSEVASTEHEAIETLLLGARVDFCDLNQKIQYSAPYGQQLATAEVKDLQVRPQVMYDGKVKRRYAGVVSIHCNAG